MNTLVEKIYQQVQQLPPASLQEVWQFVEFLQFKQQLSETDYVLNNPNLMQQIQSADQQSEQWFTPSKAQLALDEDEQNA